MRYNILGRTGLSVSELGLGGHEYRRAAFLDNGRFTELDLARIPTVNAGLAAGINYFDTTFTEEVQSLGWVLKELNVPLDKVVINGMIGAMDNGFAPDRLECALETLHAPQEKGLMRFVGASCHDPDLRPGLSMSTIPWMWS